MTGSKRSSGISSASRPEPDGPDNGRRRADARVSPTTQTNRRARAVIRSRDNNEVSHALSNDRDIGFRVDGVWHGAGAMHGSLSWVCGNCGQLLLSDFADLPFVRTPTLIVCGRCGVDSEAHRAMTLAAGSAIPAAR
jgi:hypothetical protein